MSATPTQKHELTHLFWPSACPLDSRGYLVGWRKKTVVCVATLATEGMTGSAGLRSDDLAGLCEHTTACVLGECSPFHLPRPSETPQDGDYWLSLVYVNGTLKIRGAQHEMIVVILYDRPSMRRHHFLSLRPLLKPSNFPNGSSPSSEPSSNDRLAQKMRSFDQLYPESAMPRWGKSMEMSNVLDFINCSQELDDILHGNPRVKKPCRTTPTAHSEPSQPGRFSGYLDSILVLSTSLQQFNLRLVEISSWPSRYRKITREEDNGLPDRRAEYVMLFNTLWLIANDIIFGKSSSAYLMDNSDQLAYWLEHHLQTYTVTFVKYALEWTNSYPVGLKLNDQLGQAFCIGSNSAVDFWHAYVLKYAFVALPRMIWITGCLSVFGNTLALAIASDFLTVATFHLWLIYRIFTFIFDCQLRLLGFLFNIFRGQKFNVLRGRNEPATYQLDQLILGTILFTLTIFLFPTVMAFYMLMGSTRLLIVGIHAVIDTGLSLLNHFPLFVVILRLKDPARLPAGICFEPLDHRQPGHLKVKNVPVGMTWIFADYISLWAELTSHYSPRQLFYRLCSGKPIAPLASCTSYKRP